MIIHENNTINLSVSFGSTHVHIGTFFICFIVFGKVAYPLGLKENPTHFMDIYIILGKYEPVKHISIITIKHLNVAAQSSYMFTDLTDALFCRTC